MPRLSWSIQQPPPPPPASLSPGAKLPRLLRSASGPASGMEAGLWLPGISPHPVGGPNMDLGIGYLHTGECMLWENVTGVFFPESTMHHRHPGNQPVSRRQYHPSSCRLPWQSPPAVNEVAASGRRRRGQRKSCETYKAPRRCSVCVWLVLAWWGSPARLAGSKCFLYPLPVRAKGGKGRTPLQFFGILVRLLNRLLEYTIFKFSFLKKAKSGQFLRQVN